MCSAPHGAQLGGIVKGGLLPLVFIPPFDTNIFKRSFVVFFFLIFFVMAKGVNKNLKGAYGQLFNRGAYDEYQSNAEDYQRFLDMISSPVGDVTSRDQFINPNELVDVNNYRNTRAGQMQYQSDLAAAQNYLAQQQAAYEDWYNSPSQQALRQRQAGLNPDLIGLDGEPASTGERSDINPTDGIPTNGQMALSSIDTVMNAIGSITGVMTGVGELMQVPQKIALLGSQVVGQNVTNDNIRLANIDAFEKVSHRAISDKFAAAHAVSLQPGAPAFDPAAWFADDNNFADIIPAYAPSDEPMYQHALARVRKGSQSILVDAYGYNKDAASNQTEFSKLVSNPYYDVQTKVMAAMLEPLQNAIFEAEKSRLKFSKKSSDIQSDIVDGLDAGQLAEDYQLSRNAEAAIKVADSIIQSTIARMHQNLFEVVKNSGLNVDSFSAIAMIMGQAPMKWIDILTQYLNDSIINPFGNGLLGYDSPEDVQAAKELVEEYQNSPSQYSFRPTWTVNTPAGRAAKK